MIITIMTRLRQVRTLTTNFQRLLAQATKEIKKLTSEKVKIISRYYLFGDRHQDPSLTPNHHDDNLNEGGSGAGAGEAVDGERGARPRDEEVARAAEGVGGTGEGEEEFFWSLKEWVFTTSLAFFLCSLKMREELTN